MALQLSHIFLTGCFTITPTLFSGLNKICLIWIDEINIIQTRKSFFWVSLLMRQIWLIQSLLAPAAPSIKNLSDTFEPTKLASLCDQNIGLVPPWSFCMVPPCCDFGFSTHSSYESCCVYCGTAEQLVLLSTSEPVLLLHKESYFFATAIFFWYFQVWCFQSCS